MVRLKEGGPITFTTASIQFQFPNGSIKRLLFEQGANGLLCFNSLMVRLKVTVHNPEAEFPQPCFNSLMVRLKDFLCNRDRCKRRSFNSLMVRLKAPTEYENTLTFFKFQFPNGSIKRCNAEPVQHRH